MQQLDFQFPADPTTQTIKITFVSRKNDGFAVTEDGEKAYISPTLMDRLDPPAGLDTVLQARLTENQPDHVKNGVIYRAMYIAHLPGVATTPTPPVSAVRPEAKVIAPSGDRVLGHAPVWFIEATLAEMAKHKRITAAQIGKLTGMPSADAHGHLNRMHAQKQIVRADVFTSPDQKRVSRVYWARSYKDFEGEQ